MAAFPRGRMLELGIIIMYIEVRIFGSSYKIFKIFALHIHSQSYDFYDQFLKGKPPKQKPHKRTDIVALLEIP